MKANGYDINVYVVDGTARLSAYEYTYSDAPTPVVHGTNTSRFITLALPLEPLYDQELSYLIGTDWNKETASTLQDYDGAWETLDWLLDGHAPPMLTAWAKALPEYEPEIEHHWATAGLPEMEPGTTRQVHCKNCDAIYYQKRLSWHAQAELIG